MRRKITKLEPRQLTDLPELTPQQSKFVEGLLSGKTATDAYRAAYDCSNCKPESIWSLASQLRSDIKVTQWLSAARIAGLASKSLTLDQHVAELDRIKELSMKAGNYGAAAQCEQLRGKAMGHYTERVQVTQDDPGVVWARLVQIMPELEHADEGT